MRARSLVVGVAAACAGLLVAGCTSAGVRVTRSDQHTIEGAGPSTPPPPVDGLPDVAPATWASCQAYPAPYECAQVAVPLDYRDVGGQQIDLALIRLPAARSDLRTGSLVLNPGGPGGSGLDLVYDEAETFPAAITDRFDIVGFDPRGVGESTAVRCPGSFDPSTDSYDRCIEPNALLLPYLGTVNVARDLEMIRKALGDAGLSYLGYSYGTAVGAVYADLFPDRVRAMVLDGAVDPDAGLSNTAAGGSDFYADQDFEGTISVFEDLCDATTACPAGPHTHQLVERITERIASLGVDAFPVDGRLTKGDLDDLLVNAMYNTSDWPLLAIALSDADRGDASTLSALYSWLLYGYPADVSAETDETFANIAIRCADFARRGAGSFDCSAFPDTAESLPVVTPVSTPTPVLVIGTKDDPATPARYAPRMAAALGSAVAVEWEGAGHTATLTSACITDLVTAYLVDTTVPKDGTTCPFVEGADTVRARADSVFADPDPELAASAVVDVLEADGDSPATATCVADKLVARGDQRLVVHELLGVESPDLVALRGMLEGACR